MLNPNSYPLWEGVSLVVSKAGVFSIDGMTHDRPDENRVRNEVRSRYGYAITLGQWSYDGSMWRCPVTSHLVTKATVR